MESKKHGRCEPRVRSPLGSIGRTILARQETVSLFWRFITLGHASEQAGIDVGMSPAVGGRWFRHGGGMPTLEPVEPSDRYLNSANKSKSRCFASRAMAWVRSHDVCCVIRPLSPTS